MKATIYPGVDELFEEMKRMVDHWCSPSRTALNFEQKDEDP